MNRIAVPTFPRGRAQGVDRPARPQNPPSLQDVANANIFLEDIKHNAARGGADRALEEDIAKVTAYRHSVLNAYGGPDQNNAMPAWAHELERRLNQRFTRLEVMSTRLEAMSTKMYNMFSLRGRQVPYMMVPNRDGIDPTGREINPLPPLRTVQDLRNLTAAQLNNYLDFYQLPYVRRTTREVKLGLLRNHIGCVAEV
ncbi:hypothetical protein ARMGADRAFT_1005953 [Armillaria gallica]|uniref:Mug135-like C-terminal domain-containing protein n=1 Tax=Armillaria gallica TaxID=47427 RepID=A0A2H3EVH2_ARMGA|nr:hypothetical protein ARMGADRAFT_1005953 [Armillaria gallica]